MALRPPAIARRVRNERLGNEAGVRRYVYVLQEKHDDAELHRVVRAILEEEDGEIGRRGAKRQRWRRRSGRR